MLLFVALALRSLTIFAEEVAVISHPQVPVQTLSHNALRSIFGMRLRAWPDRQGIRVFVLDDAHPLHERFAKDYLSVFPQQLRRAWDRLIYSGTGQAPTTVDSEAAMLEAVAETPGAIGYVDKNRLPASRAVMRIEVQ